jgi:hypothetical protein
MSTDVDAAAFSGLAAVGSVQLEIDRRVEIHLEISLSTKLAAAKKNAACLGMSLAGIVAGWHTKKP